LSCSVRQISLKGQGGDSCLRERETAVAMMMSNVRVQSEETEATEFLSEETHEELLKRCIILGGRWLGRDVESFFFLSSVRVVS
jgi:hypothetical protein